EGAEPADLPVGGFEAAPEVGIVLAELFSAGLGCFEAPAQRFVAGRGRRRAAAGPALHELGDSGAEVVLGVEPGAGDPGCCGDAGDGDGGSAGGSGVDGARGAGACLVV